MRGSDGENRPSKPARSFESTRLARRGGDSSKHVPASEIGGKCQELLDLRGISKKIKVSQPISRVLSWTIIHLRPASPRTCSGLPEPNASSINGFLFGLAPSGVYTATNCYQSRGALLPHLFTLTEPTTPRGLHVDQAVCFLLH